MISIVPGVRPPRSVVLVPGELTEADLAWVERQLELCELRAVREGHVGADLDRARATGRRPAYLDADEVDLSWVTTEAIR